MCGCDTQRDFEIVSVILSTAKNLYLLEKRVLRRAYGLLRTTEEWGRPILLSVILSERSESKNPLPCGESGRAADGQWPPLRYACRGLSIARPLPGSKIAPCIRKKGTGIKDSVLF